MKPHRLRPSHLPTAILCILSLPALGGLAQATQLLTDERADGVPSYGVWSSSVDAGHNGPDGEAPAPPQAPPPPEPVPVQPATPPTPLAPQSGPPPSPMPPLPGPALSSPPPLEKEGGPNVEGKRRRKERSELTVGGRVYVLSRVTDRDDKPRQEFRIGSALLEVDWRPNELVRAELSVELSAFDEEEGIGAGLRNAFVRVSPLRVLRITAGQLKKPFGRLELLSRRELPLIARGIVRDSSRDLGYSGRDIGVQLDGVLGQKDLELLYAAGVWNGAGPNQSEQDLNGAKDLAGRLELRIKRTVNVGANLSYKRFDRIAASTLSRSGVAAGLDLELRTTWVRGIAEGIVARDTTAPGARYRLGGLLLLWTSLPLRTDFILEPVLKGELLAPDANKGNLIWRGTGGLNLVMTRYLRCMVDFEHQRRSSALSGLTMNENRLLAQLAFDI